ncbi:hypothetical protein ACWEN6_12150 [Sphaerisporangium sp. NPDC004334]
MFHDVTAQGVVHVDDLPASEIGDDEGPGQARIGTKDLVVTEASVARLRSPIAATHPESAPTEVTLAEAASTEVAFADIASAEADDSARTGWGNRLNAGVPADDLQTHGKTVADMVAGVGGAYGTAQDPLAYARTVATIFPNLRCAVIRLVPWRPRLPGCSRSRADVRSARRAR